MGLNLLNDIICVCEATVQNEGASWYLHVSEEAREIKARFEKAEHDLANAAMIWSRLPMHTHVWNILQGGLYNLPQEAETFLLKKVNEEETMKQSTTKSEVETSQGSEELATTLNADAPSFIPQFMLDLGINF